MQRKVKKLSTTGEDVGGRYQSESEEKLRTLQERYGLNINVPNRSAAENFRKEAERMFQSERTQMLWMRAKENGFDDEAMELLRRELDEFDANAIDHEYKMKDLAERTVPQNEINKQARVDDEELKEMNQERKFVHKRLKRQYEQLEDRVEEGAMMNEEFFSSKLADLRQKAAEMTASDEEMEAIQSYLDHFEENLKRLQLLKSKMAHHEMNNDVRARQGRHDDSMVGSERMRNEVKEKMGFTSRSLRKLYKHLVMRIGKKDEL